ncbi:hypothetical protein CGC20_23085 [Leishmania donovani]|uniref:Uncharacterized protein n=1 Tax=Leishmania donovani TaxID=5661 RepID=A0A504Y4F4_LEIDO|nr:hypothetical protein CGC20_23085 [Leishmania donovani]
MLSGIAGIRRCAARGAGGAAAARTSGAAAAAPVCSVVATSLEDDAARAAAVVQSGMHTMGTVARVERIAAREPPSRMLHRARLLGLVRPLRSCAHDPRDVEAIALILFGRGWRAERLERAQRMKEGSLRRAPAKYKGTMSCMFGVSAVRDVFTMNRRAHRRQQRGHQLKTAIETPSKAGVLATADDAIAVKRKDEEAAGAVALACDGRLCDLAREVAMEPLTVAGAGLPRRDACTSPALAYAQHTLWAPSAPAASSTSSERAAAIWTSCLPPCTKAAAGGAVEGTAPHGPVKDVWLLRTRLFRSAAPFAGAADCRCEVR